MTKLIIYILTIIISFYLYAGYTEYRSTYLPLRNIEYTPETAGLEYEDTYVSSGRYSIINAWYIPAKDAEKVVLFCHGNAGNISHRLEKIKVFHDLGLNVFIFDYRGYGKSKGRPREYALYQDARAAYNYLIAKKGFQEKDIILFGESLGGAVAIDLATKVKANSLITESTFSSIKDIAGFVSPALGYFIPASRFNSTAKLPRVTIPKLMFHSVNDDLVNFAMALKLYNSAAEPKELVKLRGSHNTAYFDSGAIFQQAIQAFLEKYK